jgi:hypothetical protein
MPEEKTSTYLDFLSGQCRELAERFRLSGEHTEALRKFVVETSVRSWRNGRDSGFKRAQSGQTGSATN